MKKKVFATVLAGMMALSLTACGNADSTAPEENGSGTQTAAGSYTVGICQQMQHAALDSATQGFQDKLKELITADGGEVEFEVENASGESANCASIINGFVSSNVDLIMANATASLQAAQAGTADIPILGTSVTDYATALGMDNWTGTTGTNISGTADLAPLDNQMTRYGGPGSMFFRNSSPMRKPSACCIARQNRTPLTKWGSLSLCWRRWDIPAQSTRLQTPMTWLPLPLPPVLPVT